MCGFCGNVVFVYGFVCEYWLVDDIVDCEDVWYVCVYLFVDFDEVVICNCDVGFVGIDFFVVWVVVYCDEYEVVVLCFCWCFFVFEFYVDVVFFCFCVDCFGF